jgi:hypothetical protein
VEWTLGSVLAEDVVAAPVAAKASSLDSLVLAAALVSSLAAALLLKSACRNRKVSLVGCPLIAAAAASKALVAL